MYKFIFVNLYFNNAEVAATETGTLRLASKCMVTKGTTEAVPMAIGRSQREY